jgi:3-polyprenyl-4-hydroxybenzoate decarboxylase
MQIPASDWQKLVPVVKASCPRLTDLDLREAQQRLDLLAAKIQNRHWVSHEQARRTVTAALATAGVAP